MRTLTTRCNSGGQKLYPSPPLNDYNDQVLYILHKRGNLGKPSLKKKKMTFVILGGGGGSKIFKMSSF